MANWCSHNVGFFGNNVAIAKEMFDELVRKYDARDGVGFKLDMTKKSQVRNPYMFDLTVTGEGTLYDVQYSYNTKWAPNTEDIIEMAHKIGCNFEMYYSELGCGIYGYAQMIDEIVEVVDLDDDDMTQVEFDDNTEEYKFRGKLYETSDECYRILLEEKMQQNGLL